MEHRFSKRFHAKIQALLYKRGLPVMVGFIRNLSKHGMFIECAAENLSLHQPVEIELFTRNLNFSKAQRHQFFITRKEPIGIALAAFDLCQLQYAKEIENIA